MKHLLHHRSARAFIFANLICCPFFGIFAMIPMILCKELSASPFQISTLTAIKPLSAIFAFYWSHYTLRYSSDKSLAFAYFFKLAPFLLLPLFSSPTAFIAAFGMHMLLLRGVMPSWMELLKQNLSSNECSKLSSIGSSANYLAGGLLPLLFAWILDAFTGSWRWVLACTSLLGMGSVWLILALLGRGSFLQKPQKSNGSFSLIKPWVQAGKLLKRRPDFFHFQVGFFLGGAGLMIMHTVIPGYFTKTLNLTYQEMFFAICFCKGVGFSLCSPFLLRYFNISPIFSFASKIPLLAVVFPLLLALAPLHTGFIFAAYFLYGAMQSGSELAWKMSGPIFASEEDSSLYSAVNVLSVGLRGIFFPYLGAILLMVGGPFLGLVIGGLFCLSGSGYLLYYSFNFSKSKAQI